MSFIMACSLVLAEVILCSLYSLVLVKKDSPSKGVSDSYRVLSSMVLAVGGDSWSNTWFGLLVGW
jgi:hypothetical protein